MGGSDQTIGKRKTASHTPEIAKQPEVELAPGKTTGVPLVDDGPLCKNTPSKPGCYLDDDSRMLLIVALTTVLGTAMLNFQTALQNQRIRLLTTIQKNSSAWGFLAEFFFQAISGGLIGMLKKSLAAFKDKATEAIFTEGASLSVGGIDITQLSPHIAKANLDHVVGVAIQGSKGLRTTLKNAAHSGSSVASADNVEKADFLKTIQNGIGPFTNELILTAPTSMTDAEIAALVAAYSDMTYHSVEAYETNIVDLLDRYDSSRITEIGDGRSLGEDATGKRQMESVKHTVWVNAGTRTRMAVVEVYDPLYAKVQPTKGYDGKMVKWEQPEFVAWVDPLVEGAAISAESARLGRSPLIVNANTPTGMKEIDAWAKEAA